MVTITKVLDKLEVDFGALIDLVGYTDQLQSREISYFAADIRQVKLNEDHVQIVGRTSTDVWEADYKANDLGHVWVSEINGVTPTSLKNLYDLLKALR